MSRKLYIRVDANSNVAIGHLMRCLTIADACKEQKMEVEFIMAEDDGRALVESRGYSTWILHTDYQHMEEEPSLHTTLSQRENEAFAGKRLYAPAPHVCRSSKNI